MEGPSSGTFLAELGFKSPVTGGPGGPSSGGAPSLVALRDDPNFFMFLEEFLGGKDEGATLDQALSTLTDFQDALNVSRSGPNSRNNLEQAQHSKPHAVQQSRLHVVGSATPGPGEPAAAGASRQEHGSESAPAQASRAWAMASSLLQEEMGDIFGVTKAQTKSRAEVIAAIQQATQQPLQPSTTCGPALPHIQPQAPRVPGLGLSPAASSDESNSGTSHAVVSGLNVDINLCSSSATLSSNSPGVDEGSAAGLSNDWSSSALAGMPPGLQLDGPSFMGGLSSSQRLGPSPLDGSGLFDVAQPTAAGGCGRGELYMGGISGNSSSGMLIDNAGPKSTRDLTCAPLPVPLAMSMDVTEAWQRQFDQQQHQPEVKQPPPLRAGPPAVTTGIPTKRRHTNASGSNTSEPASLNAGVTTTSGIPHLSPAMPLMVPQLHSDDLRMVTALGAVPMADAAANPAAGSGSLEAPTGLCSQQQRKVGPGRKPVGWKVTPKGIKLTRSEKQKQSMGALERQVAEKLAELTLLSNENRVLQRRMQILELATGRQQMALALMSREGQGQGPASETTLLAAGLPAVLAGPGRMEPSDLQWARSVTLESFVAWWREHLQGVSAALMECSTSDSPMPGPADEALLGRIARGLGRTALLALYQPTVPLRLRNYNMDTGEAGPAPDSHWQGVIQRLCISQAQVEELSLVFATYNALHGSLTSELQEAQQELEALIQSAAENGDKLSEKYQYCDVGKLWEATAQHKVLKRVHAILQKTNVLYSATITIVAQQIMLPREFGKLCIYCYPYFPCGPSLMLACETLRGAGAGAGAGASAAAAAGGCPPALAGFPGSGSSGMVAGCATMSLGTGFTAGLGMGLAGGMGPSAAVGGGNASSGGGAAMDMGDGVWMPALHI